MRAVQKSEDTFQCADITLLRAAVRPNVPARVDPEGATVTDIEYLRSVARDSVLCEAIEISSPTLKRTIDKAVAGEPVSPKKIRRAARAARSYRIRMSSRATPFGVFAGVSTATFGPDPSVTWGEAHRKAVQVDMEWLTGVVTELEQHMDVLRTLRVVANDLCFLRGGRLVVPRQQIAAPDEAGALETSLRCTRPVLFVLNEAEYPVAVADLEKALASEFVSVDEKTLTTLLLTLVRTGVLLTELRPPPNTDDPVSDVISRLSARVDELSPETCRTLEQLTTVHRELDEYALQQLGTSSESLTATTTRMRELRAGERLVQVDLALDLRVRLPEIVRTEIEGAVEALTKIATGRGEPDPLVRFHRDFVNRYGTGRAVPLGELLDPDTGLGPPAGYGPPNGDDPPGVGSGEPDERADLLLSLVQEATIAGDREIVLNDDTLDRLSGEGTPTRSIDVLTHLLADSLSAVSSGDFRLVLAGTHPQAGAFAGRFAPLLDTTADGIGEMVRTLPARDPDSMGAQLCFHPRFARAANVARVPLWLEHRVVLGAFADRSQTNTSGLADLAVVADPDRLAVVSLRSSREIVPTMPNMLALQPNASNLVRFLHDVAYSGEAASPQWRWHAAVALPYLPRVRHGRTILSSARWRPNSPTLRDTTVDFGEWHRRFDRWRERWQVPGDVLLGTNDQKIALNLDSPEHLTLLRRECTRRPSASLTEAPAGGDYTTRWLASSDTDSVGHTSELVFSLVRRTPSNARMKWSSPLPERPVFAPGSEWLYANVRCSLARQNDILTDYLPDLIAVLPEAVDRWFYIRYVDREPQLRLRFHGNTRMLTAELLPELNAWTARLSKDGLGGRLTLDTYDPEWERYGGIGATPTAESLFHADSQASMEQLRILRSRTELDPLILTAANYVDIACRLIGNEPGIAYFLNGPTMPDSAPMVRQHADAWRFIDPVGDWQHLRSMPWGPTVLDGWARRGASVTAYGNLLRATPEAPTPVAVLPSLLHMHHNRLVGIDRQGERASLALARTALRSRQYVENGRP